MILTLVSLSHRYDMAGPKNIGDKILIPVIVSHRYAMTLMQASIMTNGCVCSCTQSALTLDSRGGAPTDHLYDARMNSLP